MLPEHIKIKRKGILGFLKHNRKKQKHQKPPEHVDMGVSLNGGTPKSSILIGFSIINHPFWGTPIFGNTHVDSYNLFFFVSLIRAANKGLRCPGHTVIDLLMFGTFWDWRSIPNQTSDWMSDRGVVSLWIDRITNQTRRLET